MAVVVLPHHFGPSITTAPFASNFACKIRSTTLALYSLMIVTPLPSAYPLFRTRAILFGILAEFRSSFWRYFVRRLGGIPFGDLAVFHSAFWRYSVRSFGWISFGVLAKEKRYRLGTSLLLSFFQRLRLSCFRPRFSQTRPAARFSFSTVLTLFRRSKSASTRFTMDSTTTAALGMMVGSCRP